MAEAIVGPLLSKLQEVAVKEAKALAEVGGDIDKLRDKLLWLHALAHEADLRNRHDGSRLVQVLAFQIRDAGFDVEDAVDHFFLQGSLLRRFGRYNWWRISKELIFNLRTHVCVRAILSRRIRYINVRLEEIIGNNSTYNLSSQSGSGDGKTWRASRAIPPMRTDWDRDYLQEFELKCRSTEETKLMEEIKKPVLKVITVVGVEGVGKTALLKHVYNQKSIKEEFDVRIWLSFGDESMLQEMKQELNNKTRGKDPNKKFRCFVVIDSPVNSTTWLNKAEKQILEMVGEGSKIVVSVTLSWHIEKIKQSNHKNVEEETHGTIQLRTMDDAKSKTLFNHIYDCGMRRGTDYQVEELDNIRKSIMKITNGLPLAVVLVAKLMRTMDMGKWKAAGDYLMCNSEDSKLKTILSVCVDDLSDELKSCLLYTAGFPENRPIDAHKLVRLWMAEGFLTQQDKLETEQLGQCYLKELIYRGLLHLKKKAPGGNVLWVAIPHQIHPLLRSEEQRTSFMHVHYGTSLPPPGNTRRLALHSYNNKFPALAHCLGKLRTVVSYSDDYKDYPYGWKQEKPSMYEHEPQQSIKEEHEPRPKPELEYNMPEPVPEQSSKDEHEPNPELELEPNPEQSSKDEPKPSPEPELEPKTEPELDPKPELELEPKPELEPNPKPKPKPKIEPESEPTLVVREFLQRSPYLRVINLEGIQVLKKKKKGHVCALPRAIGEMVHLQYLGVRCPGLKEVPSSVGKLRNLQTIDVRGTGVRSLPDSLWKVKTLRHVLGDKLAFPRSSTDVGDHLKLMQTLESVTIDHRYDDSCGCTSTGALCKRRKLELLRFRFLHRLHVADLKKSQGKDLASVLKDLSSLEALILSGKHIPMMDLFAEASKAWMKHMESLMLDGPLRQDQQDASYKELVEGPYLGRYLENVTHLVLRSTNIGQEFIHCMGQLPVLAELELLEGSYKDEKLTISNSEFYSLTMLRISGLHKDINMDVPDRVVVVTDEPISLSEQQLIVVLARKKESDQQAEGGEHDQSSSNDHSSQGGQPMEASSQLQDKHRIIEEMILEAVHSNHSSKSKITDYIKDTYVVKCLDNMLRLHWLIKEKSNNGRYEYVLDRTNRWSSPLTKEDGSPLPENLRIISEGEQVDDAVDDPEAPTGNSNGKASSSSGPPVQDGPSKRASKPNPK